MTDLYTRFQKSIKLILIITVITQLFGCASKIQKPVLPPELLLPYTVPIDKIENIKFEDKSKIINTLNRNGIILEKRDGTKVQNHKSASCERTIEMSMETTDRIVLEGSVTFNNDEIVIKGYKTGHEISKSLNFTTYAINSDTRTFEYSKVDKIIVNQLSPHFKITINESNPDECSIDIGVKKDIFYSYLKALIIMMPNAKLFQHQHCRGHETCRGYRSQP